LFLPPPLWGREPCFSLPPCGGGSLVSPSPLVGEGWGGGNCVKFNRAQDNTPRSPARTQLRSPGEAQIGWQTSRKVAGAKRFLYSGIGAFPSAEHRKLQTAHGHNDVSTPGQTSRKCCSGAETCLHGRWTGQHALADPTALYVRAAERQPDCGRKRLSRRTVACR